jgi:hypothetical protein
MKKLVITLVGLCFFTVAAWAAELELRGGAPERYTVKEGDTLWAIAGMYLEDPWLWPEIWAANPGIDNPHLIYPGDVLTLVYVDGKPQLRLERGGQAGAVVASGSSAYENSGGRNIKLSPSIKVTAHEEAIPAIPLDIVNTFLSRTRIVQPGELDAAPYVLSSHDGKLLSGKGDDFHVRGTLVGEVDFFGIYRKGDPYVDTETGEVLGIQAEDVGSAQLKFLESDISTFQATRSEGEIRVGDRLLPQEERRLDPTFFPTAPRSDIRGRIIDVEGGVNQVGTLNVVAINRGEREGLEIGNVLAIYKKGEVIRDRVSGELVALPATRAGLLMVFRTFEKMSFGLVLTAGSPLAVEDEVRSP